MRRFRLSSLLGDVRYALRQLRKSPGFTLSVVTMLALGICANSTVLSWIDSTMLRPIPRARDSGDLVSVMRGEWNSSPGPPLSYPDYAICVSGTTASLEFWRITTTGLL